MESFFRFISYADYYENGLRLYNAGYLSWKMQKNIHKVEIELRDLRDIEGTFTVVEEESKAAVTSIDLVKGKGYTSLVLQGEKCKDVEFISAGDARWEAAALKAFRIDFGNSRILRIPLELPIEKKTGSLQAAGTVSGVEKKEKNEIRQEFSQPLKEEKWQQLCSRYQKVHPFGDGKTFLSIQPEDFIILQEPYQKLVQNSFLLHGYYNYRHMILGKLNYDEKEPYYVGVPGVFYEKERQAAGLFGFAGFEGVELPVRNGSYGYYMIEVKL